MTRYEPPPPKPCDTCRCKPGVPTEERVRWCIENCENYDHYVPEENGYAVLNSEGPLIIIRLPVGKGKPRRREVLKGYTEMMRHYGLHQKDIYSLDSLFRYPDGVKPEWDAENQKRRERLDAAFFGDSDEFPEFELWDWGGREGTFVLARAVTKK